MPEREEHDQERQTQLAAFNRELSRRLDTLDQGHHIDPEQVRAKFQQKSAARRKARV